MNPTRRSRLAQLELECMKVLWEQPGASVAQVRSALDRQLAYTTVMTVLDRMTAKGVVTRRKNGRAWYYAAQLDRETARIEAVDRLLANLFDDNRTELVEYLSRRRITRPPSGSALRGTAASAVSPPPRTTRVARPTRAGGTGPRRRAAKAQPAFIPGFMDESLL